MAGGSTGLYGESLSTEWPRKDSSSTSTFS